MVNSIPPIWSLKPLHGSIHLSFELAPNLLLVSGSVTKTRFKITFVQFYSRAHVIQQLQSFTKCCCSFLETFKQCCNILQHPSKFLFASKII